MLERYIAAARIEPREIFNRCYPDVSANCVQSRVAGDRSSGDVPAAGRRHEVAGHMLDRDVTAIGVQACWPANIPYMDVATRGRDSKPPIDIFGFNVAT